ncbi:MAG TPA: c-type cytochrome [Solirubrobacterales bacterium]|nr:c-type cytochrome [Solirubrobacterales bacterium]
MSKRPFIVFGLFAALCVIVIPYFAFAKEGDEESATVNVEASDDETKELFAATCGYCHTLAAAGSDGVVGPDLDEILAPGGVNSAESFDGTYNRVLTAINCGVPIGGGRMPRNILIGEEAEDVAAFVAAYAGQIGKGPLVPVETTKRPRFQPPPGC